MGVFGAVFGCSGDVGFSGPSSGVCSGVVGFNVAMVSCLVREKVRPAALCHRESAKKFAQHAQIGPNSAFLRLLGEFFRGRAAGGAVLGEFFRANWPCVGLGCDAVHFSGWLRWGFCAMRSPLTACRRRVGGLDGVIPPPIGGGEAALLGVNGPISHVIPLWLFQDLNWRRWNCNDSGGC